MNRNVLVVTVDQWRGDCLSSAGHPVLETTALDGLAATGTRFANHWANAAPCGPSQACLYTGTYLQNHRSLHNGTPLDARFTNVALHARRAGDHPFLYGYTDTGVDPRKVGPDESGATHPGGTRSGSTASLTTGRIMPWLRPRFPRRWPEPASSPGRTTL